MQVRPGARAGFQATGQPVHLGQVASVIYSRSIASRRSSSACQWASVLGYEVGDFVAVALSRSRRLSLTAPW
jgi:hypothetical protein